MADEIEVKLNLTADDQASPTVRKLVAELKRMESQLKSRFAKGAIRDDLIGADVRKALEARKGEIKRRMSWARAERDAGRMTLTNYRALNAEINKIIGGWRKADGTFGRMGKKQEQTLRRLIGMADGFRDVWNQSYRERERLEHRFNQRMIDGENARDRLRRRSFTERMREIRFLNGVRSQTERMEARQRLQAARERAGHWDTVRGGGHRMLGAGRSALNRADGQFFNSPFFYSMMAAGAAAAGARAVLGAESKIDDAEINSRIYGGLDAAGARDHRRNWAVPKAVELGSTAAAMIEAWNEAIKAGIPAKGGEAFTELAMQAAEGWGKPLEAVTDFLGNVNTILGGFGDNFDEKKLRSVANTMQYLAKEMSTTPEKMMSFMQKGAGAAGMFGMSQESMLAFGAASTSAGNQAFASGRMADYLGTRLIPDFQQLAKGKGRDADLVRQLMRSMGYGTHAGMMRSMKDNPDDFLFDFIERFDTRIKDPKKRSEFAELITGKEWSGEFGRLLGNPRLMAEARKHRDDAKKVDALGEMWELHKMKLSFVFKQMGAGLNNILGEFGQVLSPMAQEVGRVFMDWSKASGGNLQRHFRSGLQGLINGLGFDTLGHLLKEVFPTPGNGLDISALKKTEDFFRGLARGFTSIFKTLAKAASVAGFEASAEGIGELIGQLAALSIAVHFARPAFAILGLFKDFIVGIAAAVLALVSVLKLAGVGGAIAAGGIGAGLVAALTSIAVVLGALTIVGGLMYVAVMNWDAIKSFLSSEHKVKRFNENPGPNVPIPSAPGFLWDGLKKLFHRTSDEDGDLPAFGAQNAEFVRPIREMQQDFRQLGARIQLASLGGSASALGSVIGGGGGGGSFSGGASTGAFNPFRAPDGGAGRGPVDGYGLGRGGIIGGATSALSGNKGLLDAIARAEGTAGRGDYNASLGYGRFLPGGREMKLTDKTLDEVFQLGLHMRRQPGNPNSSALGRYQIVGSTMKDAARALGMDMATTKFDETTQDKMAAWIARRQGLGAWEGFKRHPGELAAARQALQNPGSSSGSFTGSGSMGIGAEGLRVKGGIGGQAFAGGRTAAGTLALAQMIQANGVAGGLNRFTAFNDRYHAGTRSLHAAGLAGDFTLKDPRFSAQAAEDVRKQFRSAGLTDNMFKVIDEYRNPSARSTGGHIHYQFQSQMAAQIYAQYAERQRQMAEAAKLQTPSSMAASPLGASALAAGVQAQTPGGIRGGFGLGGVQQTGGPVNININGNNSDPEALANLVQRRVSEQMNWRTHDVEHDL